MNQLQHFSLQKTADDLIWLTIHIKESPRHPVDTSVLYEFLEIIASIHEKKVKGLIIQSNSPEAFLTGIQPETLTKLADRTSTQHAMGFFSLGNKLCRQIEKLNCPTVAIIDGLCSGAGLEIALACQYRVLTDRPETRLIYTEIAQGYHIGFGSITRLIDLQGMKTALSFLASSKPCPGQLCVRQGLGDKLVARYKARQQAEQIIAHIYDAGTACKDNNTNRLLAHTDKNPAPFSLDKLLPDFLISNIRLPQDHNQPLSSLQRQVLETIIGTWKTYGNSDDAKQEEVTTATRLLVAESTQHALYLQVLLDKQRQKRITRSQPEKQQPPLRVHIMGSGTIGRYLGRLCAFHGLLVSVYDIRHNALARLLPEARHYFETRAPYATERVQHALDHLIPDIENNGLRHADIIIEAIQEDKHSKASLLLEIDRGSRPEACILTTTACLPLNELSKDMLRPERLTGINLSHPFIDSPIAEVIQSDNSLSFPHDKVTDFIWRIGRLPVMVQNAPGFLSTRILMAYLREALMLHQAGTSITEIDTAASALGMTFAPFLLLDTIGLDECLTVMEALADRLGYDVPPILVQKVEQGHGGKNAGEGFYKYKQGRQQADLISAFRPSFSKKTDSRDIQKNLLEAIINEARIGLNLGIIESTEWVDLITVTNIGFPAAKGGALRYLSGKT